MISVLSWLLGIIKYALPIASLSFTELKTKFETLSQICRHIDILSICLQTVCADILSLSCLNIVSGILVVMRCSLRIICFPKLESEVRFRINPPDLHYPPFESSFKVFFSIIS